MIDLIDLKLFFYELKLKMQLQIEYITDLVYSYTPLINNTKNQGYTVIDSNRKDYYLSYEELWEL